MRCTCRFILRAAWLARTSTSAVRTGRCSAFVVSPSNHELRFRLCAILLLGKKI